MGLLPGRKPAYLHFPFLVIENPKRPLPPWKVGATSTVLGHMVYECVFANKVVLEVSANGLFIFDFKNTELKGSKSNNFNHIAYLRTQRTQFINSFLATLHSAWLGDQTIPYISYPVLANPRDSIHVTDNSASWGSLATSLYFDKHKSLSFKEGLNELQADTTTRVFVLPISVVEKGCEEFNKVVQTSAKEIDYDVFFLVDYLFRAGIALNEHHYDNAVIFSWLVIEACINKLWILNKDRHGLGDKDENRKEWTAYHKHETLRMLGIIDIGMNEQITKARKVRNDLMHKQHTIKPTEVELEKIVDLAKMLLNTVFKLDINIFLGRSLNS
jgi:hypothetical protein